MALLAQALFDYPDAKTLLLSATPYKMYTMHHERAEEDHYADFIRTARFLFNSNEQTEAFQTDLQRYREALFKLGEGDGDALLAAKKTIEAKLRRVMARTERLAVTADRDGMIAEAGFEGQLAAGDLRAFITLDRAAQSLEAQDMVEYWKSAPYLLNLMDRSGYKIKAKLTAQANMPSAAQDRDLLAALKSGRETFLPWPVIQSYGRIDPGNAKLRSLLAQTVGAGMWKLLWAPPSWPYYRPDDGPYADPQLQDFTKSLVFSAWRVVPKVIAALSSYEAERQMVIGFEQKTDYQAERKKRRPLLQFSLSKRRLTGMPNLTLLYPCLTLAREIDPLTIGAELSRKGVIPSTAQVKAAVVQKVERLLNPILGQYAGKGGRKDERWYWAALALLDRRHHRQTTAGWLNDDSDERAWASMLQSGSEQEADTHFADHVALFRQQFTAGDKLGPPPGNLSEVLAKIALASPAVTTLRALLRAGPFDQKETVAGAFLPAAAKAALGFRSLFNLPETMTLIRSLRAGDAAPYWESVLDYSVGGNLQAVMDEYLHILREALGLLDQPAEAAAGVLGEEIHTAVSLRTVNLSFDEITAGRKLKLTPHTLRCRFALRFGDEKNEDGGETRADQVRSAFNSPFRPFILATTSVGQEGLDFHQYCHQVYHWNLPSNPVDLEQREGRVHRYKGHVIRRNVAQAFPLSTFNGQLSELVDPWEALFERAKAARDDGQNDLIPYWIFEPGEGRAGYKIIRRIPALPLSRDRERLADLRRSLVAYRLVFGQPRQEDLLTYLRERIDDDLDAEELLRYRIDLSPEAG